MALTVNIGDLFRVRLGFRDLGGHVAYNVLHYRVSGISIPPPAVYQGEATFEVANQFAEDVFDHFKAEWAALASVGVGFNEVMVQSIFPLPISRQYYHIPAVAQAGAVNEDPLPLQDTPTLVKRTEVGARWGLGRVFVVGLPEGSNDAGIVSPAYETLLGDFAALFDDDITTIAGGANFTMKPVLVGAPIPGTEEPRVTDILSVALSGNTFKTQRRRRPGKGI